MKKGVFNKKAPFYIFKPCFNWLFLKIVMEMKKVFFMNQFFKPCFNWLFLKKVNYTKRPIYSSLK